MKKKSLIDPPEMPKDFWNYPYNPITGFYSNKGSSNSSIRKMYNKLLAKK